VPVELVKPDKIPPTTPIFTGYNVSDEGKVKINWINSSSDDVAEHKLFRKNIKEKDWTLIQSFGDTTHVYEDDDVKPGETVAYTLIAVDKSNNESTPAPPLTVMVGSVQKIAPIKNFKADVVKETRTVTLTWLYDNKDVVEYTIYRAQNKNPFTTWKVVGARQSSIEDKEISVSNVYRYGIRATLKNGKMSGWKEVKIEL
jgi:hypothetical protein